MNELPPLPQLLSRREAGPPGPVVESSEAGPARIVGPGTRAGNEAPPLNTEVPRQVAQVPDAGKNRTLKPIPRTNLKAMTVKILKDQGGLCLLCQRPIDLSIPKEGCVDHDHESGEVRGVLHRSCNAAEGKVANAAGRWGAKGMSYELIVPWLQNLLAYYQRGGTGYMYPGHKSPEQKAVAARLKRNTRAAEKRATAKVRNMSFKPKVNP